MKKVLKILLCVFLIICIGACSRRGSITQTGRSDVQRIVINSVPYVQLGDETLDLIWLKETDQYGRELFHYETGKWDIWVICQKSENEYVYYYEDDCYYVSENDIPIPDNKLTQLKLQNDWNKPLDNSKMTSVCFEKRKQETMYEFALQSTQGDYIEEDVRKMFKIQNHAQIFLDGIGSDFNGNAIIFVWTTVLKDGNHEIEKCYLTRYNIQQSNPVMMDYVIMNKGVNQQELIRAFRRSTG